MLDAGTEGTLKHKTPIQALANFLPQSSLTNPDI